MYCSDPATRSATCFLSFGTEVNEFLEEAPTVSFQSTVWDHFGFSATYDDDGGKKVVVKTATVCKHCATRVAYANGTLPIC